MIFTAASAGVPLLPAGLFSPAPAWTSTGCPGPFSRLTASCSITGGRLRVSTSSRCSKSNATAGRVWARHLCWIRRRRPYR